MASLIARAFNKLFRGWSEKIRLARLYKKHDLETRFYLVGDKYEIGEYTYGWPQIYDYGSNACLKIGRFTDMAHDIKILLGGNHHTEWVSDFAFYKYHSVFTNFDKGWTQQDRGDTVIGNDVWIGRGAMLMPGVKIGDGAVIEAGAVVAKEIPPYAIAVGNPARVIKYRFLPEQIEDLLKIKWWDWSESKINEFMPLLASSDIDAFIKAAKKA